ADTTDAPSAANAGPAESEHWSFRPPQPAEFSPIVGGQDAGANRVDRLIRQALASRQLDPSPSAERTTLIRRLYYDLIGLPPRFEDVQAFVQSESPDAYEQLVERLLASPRFG